MTTQIAVRLPDHLVEYVDELVESGAGSRATIVAKALVVYRQQLLGERDARILENVGDYDEFDTLVTHASIED